MAPLRALVRAERTLSAVERFGRYLVRRLRGEPVRVLVNLDWRLGDEVMALPVYEALKRADPGMTLAARVRYPELLKGNPFVDRVDPLSFTADRILDLKGEVAGEARRATLSRRAGLSLAGLPRPRVYLSEEERLNPPIATLAALERPRVAIHAGATQPCKEWGRERWRGLAARLEREGARVVEVGVGREPLGVGLSLLGLTTVRELACVLAQVDVVLGDDSGPLHLALAVGTPAVGVFGATDPTLLYPEAGGFTAVGFTGRKADADCRGCWPRRTLAWPSGHCPRPSHECMDAIPPETVLAAVLRAISVPAEVPA